jgi:electron transfer flavoprotein alpha subunit
MAVFFVCLDTINSQISAVSFELLALARQLADQAGGSVEALAVGSVSEEDLSGLGAVDKLHHAAADTDGYIPEVYRHAVGKVLQSVDSVAIFIPYSTVGMEISSALAHDSDRELVSYCRTVKARDDDFEAISMLHASRIEARTSAPSGTIFAMLPGAADAEAGRKAGATDIAPVELGELTAKTRIISHHAPDPDKLDLSKVEKIVCVGRGIGSKDNIADAEELAKLLGAEIAGTRPVIDAGWLPKERQVGKSGKRISPKLYIALGVSGAPEHLEGMSGSDLIMAINNDDSAPIFAATHYGVAADLFEVLPELADALRCLNPTCKR